MSDVISYMIEDKFIVRFDVIFSLAKSLTYIVIHHITTQYQINNAVVLQTTFPKIFVITYTTTVVHGIIVLCI